MHPKPLIRMSADEILDDLIEFRGVGGDVALRVASALDFDFLADMQLVRVKACADDEGGHHRHVIA